MREFEFIQWIRSQTKLDPTAVPVGPGDDCAIVMCGTEKLLITVDQLLEGVHFTLAEHGPKNVGRKAMARNLSDVASMAALPLGAVASVALPKGFKREDAETLYLAMKNSGETFHCPIVGGDVSVWPEKLAISITVFARPAGIKPILRSGAKAATRSASPAAWAARGGASGTSSSSANQRGPHPGQPPRTARDDRHFRRPGLRLVPPVRLLRSRCRTGGCGRAPAQRREETSPTSRRSRPALSDGEDYELLFALPQNHAEQLVREQPLTVQVTRIGTFTAEKGLVLIKPTAPRSRCRPAGGSTRRD